MPSTFFYQIILGYLLFLCTPVTNWNGSIRLLSSREISSWYHPHPWCFFNKSFTFSGITGHIFLSVTSLCLSMISKKTKLNCRIFCSIFVVYDVPPSMVYPIITYVKRILLVHIHLNQVLFILRQTCIYVINEKDIILLYFNATLIIY